jgi:hypothetical protein
MAKKRLRATGDPTTLKLLSELGTKPARKVGRPKNDDLQIFEDYVAFKIKHPKSGIDDICRFMHKDVDGRCQGRYGHIDFDAVRKRLDRAIKGYVKESETRSLPKARAEAEKNGKPWTPEAEAKARKDIRAAVMNGVTDWGRRRVLSGAGTKSS